MGYIYGGVDPDIVINGDRDGVKPSEASSQTAGLWSKATSWASGFTFTRENFSTEGIKKSIDDRFSKGSHKDPDMIHAWRQENHESSDKLLKKLRDPSLSHHLPDFINGLEDYSDALETKDPQGMIVALAKQFSTEERIANILLSSKPQDDTSGGSRVL